MAPVTETVMDVHVNDEPRAPAVYWRLRGTFLEFYSVEEDLTGCHGGCSARRAVSADAAVSLKRDLCKSPISSIASTLRRRRGTWPVDSTNCQEPEKNKEPSSNDVPLFNCDTCPRAHNIVEEDAQSPLQMELCSSNLKGDAESERDIKNKQTKRRKAKGNDNASWSAGIVEKTATTVMIRHIACRYSQDEAATFLDDVGLKGKYNFIYLPLNPTKRANLGYMFVNFVNPEYVNECKQLLTGQAFGATNTSKRCEVTLAHVQGYTNISRHFHKKAVMKGRHGPLFVLNSMETMTVAVKDQ